MATRPSQASDARGRHSVFCCHECQRKPTFSRFATLLDIQYLADILLPLDMKRYVICLNNESYPVKLEKIIFTKPLALPRSNYPKQSLRPLRLHTRSYFSVDPLPPFTSLEQPDDYRIPLFQLLFSSCWQLFALSQRVLQISVETGLARVSCV
jgi:hypothetical protein